MGVESLSRNENITWDIVQGNPEKPWNWYGLSMNPNITIEIIMKNLDKPWVWRNFSNNTFEKEKKIFLEKRIREYMAAYKIQQWWYKASISPSLRNRRKLI